MIRWHSGILLVTARLMLDLFGIFVDPQQQLLAVQDPFGRLSLSSFFPLHTYTQNQNLRPISISHLLPLKAY
jgi:hypothetical protein